MPKVRYFVRGTQGVHRKPEAMKSLPPSRLGYYQNLVVWNKVGPVQVSPVASCVQPSQAALPLASLISKPTGLSNAKLAQVLKWEPDQLGAIRTFIHDTAKTDLLQSIPLKKQNQDTVKEVLMKCRRRFPVLSSYEEDWVTLEFLRRFLKNSSGRSKV